MTASIISFIVIDDDLINNQICRRAIRVVSKEIQVETFTDPKEGLEYLSKENLTEKSEETILFLDINMPELTGWEVLSRYEKFNERIKGKIRVFMLSSSIDERDRERARQNRYVQGFIE